MDHPNVVKYVESYEDSRYLFIIMELLDEATELYTVYDNRLKEMEDKPDEPLFPEKEVMNMMHMILSGLNHIHMNGIVHRDLNAQNCILDKDFNLKIIELGCAMNVS